MKKNVSMVLLWVLGTSVVVFIGFWYMAIWVDTGIFAIRLALSALFTGFLSFIALAVIND